MHKQKEAFSVNFFEKILHSLSGTMETPSNYGWFHLMFFAIVIAVTVLLCVRFKNADDKTFRRIILISWLIILSFEIYKQIIYSFEYDGAKVTWDYLWYAFPYQLCSTPLYVLPFIAFSKDSHFRDSLISYMSVFSLFGGIAVFFYPNDVFVETIGINIQTMVHHGLQIVLGIFCVVYNRRKIERLRYFASSIPVFSFLVSIAIVMNVIGYHLLPNDTFNMFYISPYYPCTLPVLELLYPKVPFIAFIFIYIVGFVAIAAFLYNLEKGVVYLASREPLNKNAKTKQKANYII